MKNFYPSRHYGDSLTNCVAKIDDTVLSHTPPNPAHSNHEGPGTIPDHWFPISDENLRTCGGCGFQYDDTGIGAWCIHGLNPDTCEGPKE